MMEQSTEHLHRQLSAREGLEDAATTRYASVPYIPNHEPGISGKFVWTMHERSYRSVGSVVVIDDFTGQRSTGSVRKMLVELAAATRSRAVSCIEVWENLTIFAIDHHCLAVALCHIQQRLAISREWRDCAIMNIALGTSQVVVVSQC
jgi:hypothetical protein